MGRKDVLPPGKLTFTERLMVVGLAGFVLGISGTYFAMFIESPWKVGIGLLVLGRLVMRASKRMQPAQGGVHGDAHFATPEEVAEAGLTGGGSGMVIGKLPESKQRIDPLISLRIIRTPWRNAGRIRYLLDQLVMPARSNDGWAFRSLVRVPESERAAHIGFHLPTGVGKTHRVLKPSLYLCPENAVVYDPSGETVRAVAEYRRRVIGHKVYVIDPFGISGVAESDRLNVFDLMSPGDPRCFDFCNHLGHALVPEKPEAQREPFWHGATLHTSVFGLLAIIMNDNPKYRNLVTLGELLNGERLQELATALATHADPALRRRAEQVLNYKGKTLDSLLACLSTEHGWLDSPAYADVLTDSTFRVQELYSTPMDLFICVPGHRARESQPFVRMLLTAILFTAFESGPDIRRPPVRLYLDEIATIGPLEMLMALYTQGRKYGLRSASFFQSVGQVAEIAGGPDKIQTVRSQFSVELFKARDYQTAKEVSDWIGSKTVQTVSTSQQLSRNTGWSNSTGSSYSSGTSGGWSETFGTTYSETGVPAMRPEQALQMRHNEAILLAAGTPPVRVNILDHEDVERLADDKPFRRYQRKYLWRLRGMAVLLLFCGGVSLLVAGHAILEYIQNGQRLPQAGTPMRSYTQPMQQFPPLQPVPQTFPNPYFRSYAPRNPYYDGKSE